MGNVPEEFQIVSEDFEAEDQELVAQLSGPINNYVLQLNSILEGQASITAEFSRQILRAGTSLVIASSIIQPFGVLLTGWRNIDNTTEVLTQAPTVQWSPNGAGQITVDSIGLTAGQRYEVNLMIFTGLA